MNLLKRPYLRILAIAAVCAALAYIICLFVPVRYRAAETLYFPMSSEKKGGLASIAGLGSAPAGDPGSVPLLDNALSTPLPGAAPSTAVGIIESYSTISAIVEKFDLKSKWGLDDSKTYKRAEDELTAGVDPQTDFVTIAFTDNDKELAQKVVEFAQGTFDSKANSLLFNVGKTNREFIQKRLTLAEDELNRRQSTLVLVGKKSPLAVTEELEKSYYAEAAKLIDAKASLEATGKSLASLQASLTQIYGSKGIESTSQTTAVGGTNTQLGVLAKEIANRRLQLEDAMSSFQEGAVELKQAKTKVKTALEAAGGISQALKNGVAKGYDPALIEAKAQQEALKATVEAYEQAVTTFKADLENAPSAVALVRRAEDDYQTASAAVRLLKGQLAQAQIAEDRDPSRYEVLDQVHIDPNFTFPRKGLIAGVVFAICIVVQLLPYLKRLVVEE